MSSLPTFPEYSVKFSDQATASKQKLPAEVLVTLDKIVNGLSDNPKKYPERVVPASLDGTSLVYMHPDPVIQITYQIDPQAKIIYFLHFSAPRLEVPKSIFISYSHEDEEWLLEMKKYLTVLEQQGVIRFWDDGQIKPGDDWRDEIQDALDSAKAAILLVSQDFLVSDFITRFELPELLAAAEKAGKKIFWVPVSSSTVFDSHPSITKFQSLVKDPQTSLEELEEAQRKKVLVQISAKLKEVIG